MNIHNLPFGVITIIENDIAEVVIFDGIELDDKYVNQFHSFLEDHFDSNIFLLINKKNSYTYTFDAQKMIGAVDKINAIAVVAYNSSGDLSTKVLKQINKKALNLKLFITREEALIWLHKQANIKI